VNRPTRDRQFLSFTRGLLHPVVDTTALEVLEAEARKIWPNMAVAPSGLRVLHRVPYNSVTAQFSDPPSFSYQWGDAEISRTEAALRAVGRAA
jgi:hypothetical protein